MKKKCFALAGMLGLQMAVTMPVAVTAEEDTWAIYWYLCGSDLESDDGAATADLYEMMDVDLPDNVTVVIETGGAVQWQNNFVDENYLERYYYNSEGMYLDEQVQQGNMGESETLTDFLSYCKTNFPADHTAVVFWNHGGGSVEGIAYDENYDYDSLSLEEVHNAFEQVYELSEENPPFEMVGFDACLMSTIDTASILSDVSHYMVASEETEPGSGWDYQGWLTALIQDPSMSGAELGTVICDTYQEACQNLGEGTEITLSVTDLSKVGELVENFNRLGLEALVHQAEDPHFYTTFSRNAERAENYGGNSNNEGYTNLVDLGDLVSQNADNLPENAEEVLHALEECVVYRVNGSYRQKSSGLSCYFSYNNDEEEFDLFKTISASQAFANFYSYCITGALDAVQQEYLEEQSFTVEDLQEVTTFEYAEYEEEDELLPVYLDEDGYAVLELEEDLVNVLRGVYFQLAYYDEEEDMAIWLGVDNDLNMDWENGYFSDNFRDVWGSIDGALCYMEIAYESDDYNLYHIPVKLNGEDCRLHVVYDYNDEEFYILGARKENSVNGMSDRNLIQLQPGDEITTMVYYSSVDGEDDEVLIEWDTVTVTEDTCFYEEELGDGSFFMQFKLVDCRNNERWSETVWFDVEDGMICADL